ncbi:DUF3352 domain-containing protein [cf. Phormidesmis sp. LEGE 11477]|uniref:DUF3352 domain-containing protein n=1 Tax=cf. Phormidesmis sp. LEGE 11477 TaxID=1828680 RepID=UPI0018814D60|nr:DUF3352 domain-containing protein [cf. Phormidesmis sp. LEGE 11477]MBE9059651.1 DUF3352 domain-containing protein [cf. Phormidesmis sp. LEGE 11477]
MAKEIDSESGKDTIHSATHPTGRSIKGTVYTPNSSEDHLEEELPSSEPLENSQADIQSDIQSEALSEPADPFIQTQTELPAPLSDTADTETDNTETADIETVDQEAVDRAASDEVLEPKTANESSKFAPSIFLPKLPKALPKLAGLAAVILLGGGVITALNLSVRSPRSLSPVGAQIVPKDTLATLTLTTDEIAWTKLRQFGTSDSQAQVDQLLTDWKDRLFTLNGYSFKRDIKPWIGDRVTLAFLPTDQPQAKGLAAATQNIVLIAPIDDPSKAKSLLESGPQRSAITWEDRSYKNISIKTIQTAEGQTIEAAVIGSNWLLLGNTAAGIEQAIDTYRGKQSLRDNAGYRSATAGLADPQPLGKSFAQLYLNIPIASAALSAPKGASIAQPANLVPLQGSQGIVATALIESEGIRFRGTSWLLPKNDLAYEGLSNEADDMLRRLPSDTLVALSGSNLQQTWQALSEDNVSPPFFPDAQTLRAGLLTQTGLDIEEDIMPWASGEFAFGLLPPASDLTEENEAENEAEGNEAEQNETAENETGQDEGDSSAIAAASLLLMVQTNDRATAESVWAQIDDVMVDRYRYRTETTDLPEGSVTHWISPFQGVQFSHGWLPGNVAFFAVGGGAAEAITSTPNPPLVGTNLFQTLTDSAPTPNHGQFFLNLAEINDTDSIFPLPQLSQELSAQGPTSAIQAIGLTSTVGDRTMDYDLYIKLSKADRPGPL